MGRSTQIQKIKAWEVNKKRPQKKFVFGKKQKQTLNWVTSMSGNIINYEDIFYHLGIHLTKRKLSEGESKQKPRILQINEIGKHFREFWQMLKSLPLKKKIWQIKSRRERTRPYQNLVVYKTWWRNLGWHTRFLNNHIKELSVIVGW